MMLSIADLEPGRLAVVFLVLRRLAERDEMEYLVVDTDPGMAGDHGMRANRCPGADLDVLADDRVGSDLDVVASRAPGATSAVG